MGPWTIVLSLLSDARAETIVELNDASVLVHPANIAGSRLL